MVFEITEKTIIFGANKNSNATNIKVTTKEYTCSLKRKWKNSRLISLQSFIRYIYIIDINIPFHIHEFPTLIRVKYSSALVKKNEHYLCLLHQ